MAVFLQKPKFPSFIWRIFILKLCIYEKLFQFLFFGSLQCKILPPKKNTSYSAQFSHVCNLQDFIPGLQSCKISTRFLDIGRNFLKGILKVEANQHPQMHHERWIVCCQYVVFFVGFHFPS